MSDPKRQRVSSVPQPLEFVYEDFIKKRKSFSDLTSQDILATEREKKNFVVIEKCLFKDNTSSLIWLLVRSEIEVAGDPRKVYAFGMNLNTIGQMEEKKIIKMLNFIKESEYLSILILDKHIPTKCKEDIAVRKQSVDFYLPVFFCSTDKMKNLKKNLWKEVKTVKNFWYSKIHYTFNYKKRLLKHLQLLEVEIEEIEADVDITELEDLVFVNANRDLSRGFDLILKSKDWKVGGYLALENENNGIINEIVEINGRPDIFLTKTIIMKIMKLNATESEYDSCYGRNFVQRSQLLKNIPKQKNNTIQDMARDFNLIWKPRVIDLSEVDKEAEEVEQLVENQSLMEIAELKQEVKDVLNLFLEVFFKHVCVVYLNEKVKLFYKKSNSYTINENALETGGQLQRDSLRGGLVPFCKNLGFLKVKYKVKKKGKEDEFEEKIKSVLNLNSLETLLLQQLDHIYTGTIYYPIPMFPSEQLKQHINSAHEFNLFNGFATGPLTCQGLIEEAIENGRKTLFQEVFDHTMNWFFMARFTFFSDSKTPEEAWLNTLVLFGQFLYKLKDPLAHISMVPHCVGPGGCGKTQFTSWVAESLFGKQNVMSGSNVVNYVESKFNAHLSEILYAVIDEKKPKKNEWETMKNLTNSQSQTTERKGIDIDVTENAANVVRTLFTIVRNPMSQEMNKSLDDEMFYDRREFLFSCQPKLKSAFFKKQQENRVLDSFLLFITSNPDYTGEPIKTYIDAPQTQFSYREKFKTDGDPLFKAFTLTFSEAIEIRIETLGLNRKYVHDSTFKQFQDAGKNLFTQRLDEQNDINISDFKSISLNKLTLEENVGFTSNFALLCQSEDCIKFDWNNSTPYMDFFQDCFSISNWTYIPLHLLFMICKSFVELPQKNFRKNVEMFINNKNWGQYFKIEDNVTFLDLYQTYPESVKDFLSDQNIYGPTEINKLPQNVKPYYRSKPSDGGRSQACFFTKNDAITFSNWGDANVGAGFIDGFIKVLNFDSLSTRLDELTENAIVSVMDYNCSTTPLPWFMLPINFYEHLKRLFTELGWEEDIFPYTSTFRTFIHQFKTFFINNHENMSNLLNNYAKRKDLRDELENDQTFAQLIKKFEV